jgi:hypothetical protein
MTKQELKAATTETLLALYGSCLANADQLPRELETARAEEEAAEERRKGIYEDLSRARDTMDKVHTELRYSRLT